MSKAIVGKVYTHHKGKQYEVLALGRIEATLEECVVYKALYSTPEFGDNAVFVRPKQDFEGEVNIDGITTERFTLLQKQ